MDELGGLERGKDGVPLPEEVELAGLEVGTEGECDVAEDDREEAGEEPELEGVGNDNDGPEDEEECDE